MYVQQQEVEQCTFTREASRLEMPLMQMELPVKCELHHMPFKVTYIGLNDSVGVKRTFEWNIAVTISFHEYLTKLYTL
jgi:hypothetical protein